MLWLCGLLMLSCHALCAGLRRVRGDPIRKVISATERAERAAAEVAAMQKARQQNQRSDNGIRVGDAAERRRDESNGGGLLELQGRIERRNARGVCVWLVVCSGVMLR